MSAWQIHEYGDVDKLTLSNTISVPIIQRPHEVLVEVHAASVNPVDVMMLGGYGRNVLNAMRRIKGTLRYGSEFPLTLGRDFSGKIVGFGKEVDRNKFQIDSEVWGAGNVVYQGTFAQYVTVSSKEIWLKPKKLSHVEAASIPYVAATTWTAIRTVGQFTDLKMRGKRALVVGASGGIGTFAVQLLKAWGGDVTGVCSSDATEKVLQLGANTVIDYKQHDVWRELDRVGKFDLILDAVGGDTALHCIGLLKPGAMYVSIVVPFLRNTDELGVLRGTCKTSMQMAQLACKALWQRKHLRWGLFRPSGEAMKAVSKLVDDEKIVPVIEKVFSFYELPGAFGKVAGKHNRGKTVLDMKDLVAK
jgi:NADPH:quinone reductase-like Zn-dependent oxidoreductase